MVGDRWGGHEPRLPDLLLDTRPEPQVVTVSSESGIRCEIVVYRVLWVGVMVRKTYFTKRDTHLHRLALLLL